MNLKYCPKCDRYNLNKWQKYCGIHGNKLIQKQLEMREVDEYMFITRGYGVTNR